MLVILSLLFLWPHNKPQREQAWVEYAPTKPAHPSEALPKDSLFDFDPNQVSAHQLQALGLTKRQVATFLNYRNSGVRFRRPEDVARCYAISDSLYRRLQPFIRIPREATNAAPTVRTVSPDTTVRRHHTPERFPFDPNRLSEAEFCRLGFTPRQAATICRYRASGARFKDMEDFGRCYAVSKEMLEQLRPYLRIDTLALRNRADSTSSVASPATSAPLLELNSADSAALVGLVGIGPLTAGRIIRYRQRLGGFCRSEQLQEVEGVIPKNYLKILPQIRIDLSRIQKIDINFASPLQMRDHPYLPEQLLNRLLKYRQLKGGWRSIGELTEQNILSEAEAEKLAPYFRFDQ